MMNRLGNNLSILIASNLIIGTYYVYEIIFHLFVDLYLVPIEQREPMISELIGVIHELCDSIVLFMIASLLDKRFYFERSYMISILVPWQKPAPIPQIEIEMRPIQMGQIYHLTISNKEQENLEFKEFTVILNP